MYRSDSESDLTSTATNTTTSRMTKSTSAFDLSGQGLNKPTSFFKNHKYPAYMQNLPICKSLQRAEEVKKLKHLVYTREKATDRIKNDRNELMDLRTCLIAFININQKVSNLSVFIERNELKALYQIIRTDRDDLRKQVKDLENEKTNLTSDIQKLNESLTQLDVDVQKFHSFIEENFKSNYSIDNIHERFTEIDKDDQNEAYNIPCTHPTMLRGMLHIYTKYLAFESIVIMSVKEEQSRTLVIQVDNIQQMSKSHSLLHDCGIILHVTNRAKQNEKIEFSEFKNADERDKAFDLIFSLAFNAKE